MGVWSAASDVYKKQGVRCGRGFVCGSGSARLRFRLESVSARFGFGSARCGFGSDRLGFGSARLGFGSALLGICSARVGLGSDRLCLGSDLID